MGRARAALAARTTVDRLLETAVKAFGFELGGETETFDDFFDAISFTRPLCEDLGGDVGSEGWYLWQVGEWAILGDISLNLQTAYDALNTLSEAFGDVVVAAADSYFEYAHFALYANGEMSRRLTLEDEEEVVEGLPIKAEQGRQLAEFSEEEANRLWTSYGLPTFEEDPLEGTFRCQQVKRID